MPTTGRFFTGMPEVIQKLPFLHYAITINGAQVYDIRENKAVSTAEIPLETALRVLEYLDGFPVIYDCYQDNWGWMTRSMQENAAAFVPIDHSLRMVRSLRTPVDELKAYLREQNRSVQKLQLFTPDDALRGRLLIDLAERFPCLSVSTSMPCNIEINDAHANKGRGHCVSGSVSRPADGGNDGNRRWAERQEHDPDGGPRRGHGECVSGNSGACR